jgi:hypothetical protein
MTSSPQDRLLAIATEQLCLSRDEILAAITEPQWPERGPARNWMDHVPQCIRGNWKALSADARLAFFVSAFFVHEDCSLRADL